MSKEEHGFGRVGCADQALVASDQAASRLDPTGFDPSRIRELIDEGDGYWHSCTGCHETVDGQETGHYPFNAAFGCYLGGGCGECGGIGAVWDNTDWNDFAEWSIARDRTRDNIKATLGETLRVFDGRIIGLDDAADAILALEPRDRDASEAENAERSGAVEPEGSQPGAKASPNV